MIFNCQRKTPRQSTEWHIHQVEAPDEATARIMMCNRSHSRDWLNLNKTLVWSAEEWIAT